VIYAFAIAFTAFIAFVLWRGEFYLLFMPDPPAWSRVSRADNPVAFWVIMFFFAFVFVMAFAVLFLQP
jgi:hypothetical protein